MSCGDIEQRQRLCADGGIWILQAQHHAYNSPRDRNQGSGHPLGSPRHHRLRRPANNQLTPFGTAPDPGVSVPAAAPPGQIAGVAPGVGVEAQIVAAVNQHGAPVVRFTKSAAGNRGVWAGGAEVILTANHGNAPDVGPRALKIRSMITEFTAANNAAIANMGGGGFFGGGQGAKPWSHQSFQIGGVTVPGNSRTGGAVPTSDLEAAIDDLTASGRAPALCAFRVKSGQGCSSYC